MTALLAYGIEPPIIFILLVMIASVIAAAADCRRKLETPADPRTKTVTIRLLGEFERAVKERTLVEAETGVVSDTHRTAVNLARERVLRTLNKDVTT